MTDAIRKRGRPQDEKRRRILEQLAQQRMHVRALAQSLQLSRGDVMHTVRRMKDAGEVTVSEYARVEWSTRPVALLEVVTPQLQARAANSGIDLRECAFLLARRSPGFD